MVGGESHPPRSRVVQVGECDLVLGSDLVTNDDLTDVIELIPILVLLEDVSEQWFELRTTWNSHIQRLCRVQRSFVEQVVIILIHDIGTQLVS